MKKLNSKGFTLIETLATIAIIAVVMTIFYPTISNIMDSFNKETVENKQEAAIAAAKEYIDDGNGVASLSCGPSLDNQTILISINNLVDAHYLNVNKKDSYYYNGDDLKNHSIKVTYSCSLRKFTKYEFVEES